MKTSKTNETTPTPYEHSTTAPVPASWSIPPPKFDTSEHAQVIVGGDGEVRGYVRPAPLIHARLAAVTKSIAAVAKTRTATVQMKTGGSYTYRFRGIDDIYAAVHDALGEHGVHMVPTIGDCVHDGNNTAVSIAVRFYAEDGSWVEARCPGEGNDNSDKGIGKAVSYGMKSLLIATFAIPTEDDNDNENNDTRTKKGKPPGVGKPAASSPPAAQPARDKMPLSAGALLMLTDIGGASTFEALDELKPAIRELEEPELSRLKQAWKAREIVLRDAQIKAQGELPAHAMTEAEKAQALERERRDAAT